jgi:transposase
VACSGPEQPRRLIYRGALKDQAAICTAITSPWSNGQITKLKLVKRLMDGR